MYLKNLKGQSNWFLTQLPLTPCLSDLPRLRKWQPHLVAQGENTGDHPWFLFSSHSAPNLSVSLLALSPTYIPSATSCYHSQCCAPSPGHTAFLLWDRGNGFLTSFPLLHPPLVHPPCRSRLKCKSDSVSGLCWNLPVIFTETGNT